MPRARLPLLLVLTVVLILLGGAACSKAEPMEAPRASTEWADYTTQTASYRIILRTGPMVTMDVMQMGATMTVVDQGQSVNHHIEVHIFDKGSGAEVKSLIPAVRITDQATGASRELAATVHPSGEIPHVTACLLANHRVKEPHFGDNLYLANGKYNVTVSVGNETTTSEISL